MQLMFLAGVSLTIGPHATLRFFMRRKNLKVRAAPAVFHFFSSSPPVLVWKSKLCLLTPCLLPCVAEPQLDC